MSATLYEQGPTAVTTSGTTGPLSVPSAESELAVDVNVSVVSGTTPTLDLYLEHLGADGVWYTTWHPTQITAVGTASTSVGPGAATPAVLTQTVRLRWAVGGTTPSFTFSASIIARP